MSERSECEALDAGVDAAESFDQVPEAIEHTDGSPQTAAEPLALVSARRDDAFEAALRSFGDAEDLVRYILKNCPPPHEPLWASCCEIGTGMLSPVLGPLRLELRQPRALFATKLAGFGSVGWSSYRFHQNSAGVHLHGLTVDDPPDAVRFDAATGTIHTQVSAFPDDGRWYLYCLVRDDVFRTTALTREVFAVARAPGCVR